MAAREQLLRTQLFHWLLYPLLGLLAVDAVVSYGIAIGFARSAYDKALVEIARDLSLQVRAEPGGTLYLDLPEAARRVLLDDPVDTVSFQLSDYRDRLVSGEAIPPAPSGSNGSGVRKETLYDTVLGTEAVRAVQLHVPDRGGAIVRVAETRSKRTAMAREILLAVVLPQILLIVLAGVLVRFGVMRGLRPLDQLQRAIAERSYKDRSPLREEGVPGEVRPLVVSINALLGRLDNVLTLQSRFIADAAHQLKTPVAGLMAQVELLARHPDETEVRSITARLYVGVERLSRLVSQLLALARNEPDAVRALAFETIDLNALTLDAASQWVPVALKRDIDLGFEGPEGAVLISGDASRLRELLDNLLDNAIRYSQHGGRVTVRVAGGQSPTVSVSDDGPTIPPADRARIFERFHRLLGSGDGSGLGLAIAQEIANIHNATIALSDDEHDGVGNVFSVIFPAL